MDNINISIELKEKDQTLSWEKLSCTANEAINLMRASTKVVIDRYCQTKPLPIAVFNAMTCIECGNDVDPDANYCSQCGMMQEK